MIDACKNEFKKADDGEASITFENRDRYTGTVKNGKPNGEGTYTTAKGEIRKGKFENGTAEGKGVFKYKDGSVFEGEWQNGEKIGKGKLTTLKGYKKTSTIELDKKYRKYNEKNINYFNPNGKEISELEYKESLK